MLAQAHHITINIRQEAGRVTGHRSHSLQLKEYQISRENPTTKPKGSTPMGYHNSSHLYESHSYDIAQSGRSLINLEVILDSFTIRM